MEVRNFLRGVDPETQPLRIGFWRQQIYDKDLQDFEELMAIGYLGGTVPPSETVGIVVHDKGSVQPGLNLWNSNHAPEAYVMDMEGKILHTWTVPFHEVWPDYTDPTDYAEFFRRVHPFPNGNLLGVFDGLGMVLVDKDSNLIWANDAGFHHDIDIADDGRIVVLTRKEHIVPRINATKRISEDFVAIVDPKNGQILREVSLLECIENSPHYSPLLLTVSPLVGDIMHTNSIQLMDGSLSDRIPAFKRGNVLISFWMLNAIAVIDMEAESVAWVWQEISLRQHDPQLLDNGNLLFFDNRGERWRSRILEMDPITQEVEWSYRDSAETPLFSGILGAVQRLANGNTLITESDAGRAIEVTRQGRIVWEFRNHHRIGKNGEFVAKIFEVQRLPATYGAEWIDSPHAELTN